MLQALFRLAVITSAFATTASLAASMTPRDEIEAKGFKLVLDSSPLGNLTFQLDCMANLIHCDVDSIRAFWKTQDWSAEDEAALGTWAKLQDRYNGLELNLPEATDDELQRIGYPLRHRAVSFDQRFREIGFAASDEREYRSHIGILMKADDADEALSVIRHFEPRFDAWWKNAGLKSTYSYVHSFSGLMKEKHIIDILETSVAFFRSRIPTTGNVQIHFIPLPSPSGHTSGEQIENHLLVEFLPNENPADRVDVLCHEIFHYFFSLASAEDHKSLVSFFASSDAPEAIPAYNLLNEVLATAFGNGMVGRAAHSAEWFKKMLSKERSFYNDHGIDSVAKAILPELDREAADQGSLYTPSFQNTYLATVRKTLGEEGTAPQYFLRISAVFYEPPFKESYRKFERKARTESSYSSSDAEAESVQNRLRLLPRLSGLAILRPERISLMSHWSGLLPSSALREIRIAAKSKKPFLYSAKRGRNAWIYVAVGKPGAEMETLLQKLIDARKPFTGFLH